MRVTPTTKQALTRTASALLGVWLFVVLFAYFGVLKLSGLAADLALLTVLVILVQAIWDFFVRPILGLPERSTRVVVVAAVILGSIFIAMFYSGMFMHGD